MSNGPRDLQAVMEGKGAYNKYATLQAAGGALALPLLEKAALEIDLGPEDAPIVIADYGSSQGKNSLAPMRAAIATLRTRIGPNRPIIVFHTDQQGNDFNTLFETLNTDPDRYDANEPSVFACAIGRSFYDNRTMCISGGALTPPYGSAESRRPSRITLWLTAVQVLCVLSSTAKALKTGKHSSRCGQAN